MSRSTSGQPPSGIRVGVSLSSGYGAPDARTAAGWLVERGRAAAAADLDLLCLGDHHATGPFTYFQNGPAMGRLLADWGDGRAGALYLVPLWNPVLVAEQVGTLAALARGTFVVQVAVGGGDEQFRAMGASTRTRGQALEDGIVKIRALLAGEQVDGAAVAPVPTEPVEIWVGATADRAIDRAARLGDAWYAGPELPPPAAAERLRYYLDRCAHHGTTPASVPIRRDVFVAEDEAEAVAVGAPAADGHRGFPPGSVVVGTPEQVAEAFAALCAPGFTEVTARQIGVSQEHAVASIERLAEVRHLLA